MVHENFLACVAGGIYHIWILYYSDAILFLFRMLSCKKNRDESLKSFSLDFNANYALPLTLPAIQASNLQARI